MEKKEEIRIPWGSGIVGYVADSGVTVNIPDAYQVSSFYSLWVFYWNEKKIEKISSFVYSFKRGKQ